MPSINCTAFMYKGLLAHPSGPRVGGTIIGADWISSDMFRWLKTPQKGEKIPQTSVLAVEC